MVQTEESITSALPDALDPAWLENVLNHLNDAVLITEAEPLDEPGPRILWANRVFYQSTGYEPGDVIGKTPRILQGLLTDQSTLKELSKALRNWEICRVEVLNYKKDGSAFWNEFEVTPVANEAGWYTHWIAVQRDVTERKRAEANYRSKLETLVSERTAELEASQLEAERANAAKSEFLSRVSHELRTPLNAVMGFSQLLAMDDLLSGDQRKNLDEILTAGTHLLELVNEVLDLSLIERGHFFVEIGPVALSPLIENCLSQLRGEAEAHGVTLVWDGMPQTLQADQMRLRQVLLNLLSNAIKYNRRGGEVRVLCSPVEGGHIRVSVSDTGRGIAHELQACLFRPFERLDSWHSGIEGTGIGLSLTKRLLEAMNGEIGVESEPDKGSTFWFELPAAK